MKFIRVETSKFSELKKEVSVIVQHHFTLYRNPENEFQKQFDSIEKIINFLAKSDYEASCNFVIHSDGTIYEIVSPSYASWHAGKSHHKGKHINHSVNTFSIGIENIRDQENNFEFTNTQYLSNVLLCKQLMQNNNILPNDITTHEAVRREYNLFAENTNLEKAEEKNDPLKWDTNLFYELLYSSGLDKYYSLGNFNKLFRLE